MAYFAPYVDASGIHMPTYEGRLQDLLSACRAIFGQEAALSAGHSGASAPVLYLRFVRFVVKSS